MKKNNIHIISNIQNFLSKQNKLTIGILVVAFYYIVSFFNTLPFTIFNINIAALPLWYKIFYSLTYQIVELAIIIFLLYPDLKKNFDDLKKHHKEYFSKYFKYWFLLLGLMMISNLLVSFFTPTEIASNEESIREMLEFTPIYTFIASVFIAPFLEEFTFRKGIRNIISNDTLFILISGILFGSMHVITSFTAYSELLYIIPYSIPGIIFAYLLVKTDNVLIPASIHFMHNGILMSLQILFLLLG